ncbi:MAG TPA: ATP-binding cassette domain-containing protein, partial [Vineibacter sp.]|nr:ATP-binding cassette domain-containing protein [Vineibacter sp.]
MARPLTIGKNMGSINLRDVSVLTPTPLFRNLTLTIGDGDRVGLVAGNGAGKSTLLRCLAGQAEPTSGDVVRSRGLRIAMVEQTVPDSLLNLTLDEAVRRALPAAEREAAAWRIDVTLDALGVPDDLRTRPLREASGGWQRLALIARAWIVEPDALLLDEPTNHLDLAKIQLLERLITDPSRRTIMVIASHDRQFLDACTTRSLFLREGVSCLYAFPYSRARQLLSDDDAAREAAREREAREIRRLRQSSNELRNIGINSRSDAAQRKSMLMARRAQRMEQAMRPLHVERSADIRL